MPNIMIHKIFCNVLFPTIYFSIMRIASNCYSQIIILGQVFHEVVLAIYLQSIPLIHKGGIVSLSFINRTNRIN